MNITKLFTVIVLNLLISVPTYATAVEQKDLKFMPDIDALMKGDIQYALEVVAPDKLNEQYPDFFYLDSLAFSQEPNVQLVIGKSAYIVDKPAGFFDHTISGNENYQKHILGEQQVKKLSDNNFKVTVPGNTTYSYRMKNYFDSDDISTLPNSKVIRAVTQSKKLDVISGSATATIFKEMTKFTKYSVGGIIVNNYIPMKENKTLVLTYSLTAVKKYYALPAVLKRSFKEEAESQKKLINSYKSN